MLSVVSTERLLTALERARRDVVLHVFSAVCLLILWRCLPPDARFLLGWVGTILTFGALTLAVAWLLERFLPNPKLNPTGKAVLITGCDRGFGELLARRLDSDGFKVFAGCLFPDSVEARALEERSVSGLRVIPLDVTKDQQVTDAVQELERMLGKHHLWAVVCNAGVNLFLEFEWMSQRDVSWMFDVNVHGTVRVVRAFLPLLRRSRGRLVLVSSYAGRVAPMWIVPYAMTKAAIIALADGLSRELAKWKISVSTIEPTYYLTDINPRTEQHMFGKFAELPESVRIAYSEFYARDRCSGIVRFLKRISRTDLSEVVDAMADAVSRTRSRRYYRCDGTVSWCLTLLFFSLPSFFADVAVAMTWGSSYSPDQKGVLKRIGGHTGKGS
ncbi:retinol dehydrogenase 16 [Ixodes scapularis]